MSSVTTPRLCSTAYSASPKSSPTGPTTRVSARKEDASEKCTAAPPSRRSRLPNWVSTASKAMEPTTVSDISAQEGSLRRKVRAIRIDEWGGPEVLRLVEDAPVPEPGEGETLTRVSLAGVNYADTHARTNDYLARFELPLIPGSEVVGTTEDGRRVVAIVAHGGYAEYAGAPFPIPVPDDVSDTAALALLIQGLTAWHLYKTSARVEPGESVVVHAAAGGGGALGVPPRKATAARGPARQGVRRARDPDRLDAGEARAGAGARRRRRRRRQRSRSRPAAARGQ